MNRFSTQQNGLTNSFFFIWRLSRFGKELFIYKYKKYRSFHFLSVPLMHFVFGCCCNFLSKKRPLDTLAFVFFCRSLSFDGRESSLHKMDRKLYTTFKYILILRLCLANSNYISSTQTSTEIRFVVAKVFRELLLQHIKCFFHSTHQTSLTH